MTGEDIQSYVETRTGRTIERDLILEAINEGLDEIGDMALLYDTATVDISEIEQWYSLPDDFTYVEKVLKIEDDEEYIYQRWEFRNGSIKFFDKGEYEIVARKMPKHLEEISDSFEDIHRFYYNSLKYYALAWIKENDDFEDPAAQALYERFTEKVKRSANKLLSTKPPSKVRVIRHA